MADKKIKDNDLSLEELIAKRDRLKREYMDLRFKMVISHVDNPMQKRTMRHEIARLNTFIWQKTPDEQKPRKKRRGKVARHKR